MSATHHISRNPCSCMKQHLQGKAVRSRLDPELQKRWHGKSKGETGLESRSSHRLPFRLTSNLMRLGL
jgi:hypothetical protein